MLSNADFDARMYPERRGKQPFAVASRQRGVSRTRRVGVAHNASKTLTYSLGGAVVFSGDADVDQTSQGVRFKGDFDTNVAFVLGGSLQWRF
jgi:hypothetical protein